MDLGTNTQCVLLGVNQEKFDCTHAQNKLDFSSMPAAGDVGRGDKGHQLSVGRDAIRAEAFA